MRKIACFVVSAILLAGLSGCFSKTDYSEDIPAAQPAAMDEEAEYSLGKSIPDESKGDEKDKIKPVDIEEKVDGEARESEETLKNKDIKVQDESNKNSVQVDKANDSAVGSGASNGSSGDGAKSEAVSNLNSSGSGNGSNAGKTGVSDKNKTDSTSAASVKSEGAGKSGSSNVGSEVKGSSDKGTMNIIVEKQGLVELTKLDDSFVIDIKYATEDNFAKKKIYSIPLCLIHKNTAKKLIAANNEFKTLGYRIKVFDAYRPYSVQQVLWDAAEDKSYLADPKKGSKHNRGAAVDITLVDENGQELPMPSNYDEFSERAHLKYNQCDEQLIKNRELLGEIMVKHGFKRISTEWWHFDDVDALNYPLLDISFEEFIEEN